MLQESTKDGSVDLYYDNSKKFETAGAGVTVTGTTFSDQLSVTGVSTFSTLNVSGITTFQGNIDASGITLDLGSETSQLNIGRSGDRIEMSHNTSNGNLTCTTGYMYIRGASGFRVQKEGSGTDDIIKADVDGAVELYYDDVKKFETTGAGVTVTGTTSSNQLNISGISTFNGKTRILDDVEFHVGTNGVSGDYKFYRDSGNSYNVLYEDISGGEARFIGAVSGTGNESNFTFLKSSNALSKFTQNGILLYANNSQRFRTNGDGIIVTGGAVVSGVATASALHVGLVTASSTTGVTTYYGDTSNAVDGRWVLSGDGSNYTFTGIGITSGNNTDPILYLARARVYEFVNTQPSAHPLVIRDSNGGTQWTAGVSTSFDGTNDILRFEVPMNAPNGSYIINAPIMLVWATTSLFIQTYHKNSLINK